MAKLTHYPRRGAEKPLGCATQRRRETTCGHVLSEECLNRELSSAGLKIDRQPALNVAYDGADLHRTFRPDFVVNSEVVVEVKAGAHILPVHQAQLLTYLELSGHERGLIINFNTAQLIRGVKRLILTRQHC
ncbi:MAG: GxxExxY protein [Gemmatimonadaceae bacterium]|nr:GxxExxY protein [Gemmatimonadaceae bacterium]